MAVNGSVAAFVASTWIPIFWSEVVDPFRALPTARAADSVSTPIFRERSAMSGVRATVCSWVAPNCTSIAWPATRASPSAAVFDWVAWATSRRADALIFAEAAEFFALLFSFCAATSASTNWVTA